MSTKSLSINRAPVLTLWAAVVAQRLGFDEDEALTLGKAVAGLNAQSKGRRLGIFKPHEEKAHKARKKEPGERFLIEVCGRPVPAKNTDNGIRAVQKSQPIDPESVRRYLHNKFGDDLKAVKSAMQKLAKAYKPQQLAHDAYALYERFRPDIFTSDLTVYLEVARTHLLERLHIHKGDHRRAQIKPCVAESEDRPVELADLFFADGTTTRRVPFGSFSFVD